MTAPGPESTPHAWEQLRACQALTVLSSAALRDVFAATVERALGAGQALLRQGEQADGLLILLEGRAFATVHRPDGEARVGEFTSGDIVGEMALVTHEPRSADVIAETPVRALWLPKTEFERLATRHLQLGIVLTHLVADRLGRATHDGFGGKILEGFQIQRCVGRGGMSVVYEALDESTGERVALKMMSYRLIYDAFALERFQQEAELVQGLDHANIARLWRLFPAYRTYVLVMEFCEGVNLDHIVQTRGPLPEALVRPVLGQLATALEYVHGQGIIHRDLKPANVMLTRTGQVKLTDFGVAISTAPSDDDRTRTGQQTVVGTPVFMAPEQLLGGVLDRRTDIYALACLAYELLAGRHLFQATGPLDMLQEKMKPPLPAADRIGAGVSDELYGFLQSALQVDPEARPSSLAALAEWAAPCDALAAGLERSAAGGVNDPTV